ncbi:DUF1206 domain-containing protein [Ekhidna sp.]|uniref:DUF1206 domain-containing protein n=1 Tax=Ekhidna sp. TaxID=2608089 RepID=UPI003298E548
MSNQKKEIFARFGIVSKGFVYILMGLLITLTTLNMGGKTTGRSGALVYLSNEEYGKYLLTIIIAGLTGYVFWRIYQSISDLDNDGRDWQGIFNRLGYLGSGLFYAFLALTGSKILLGLSSNSTGIKKEIIGSLLESTLGQMIVAIIGIVLVGRAIFQLYFAYSGMYKKRLDESELENKTRSVLIAAGIVGYTSRGLVIGSIAFLTFKSIYTLNASNIGGTEDAISMLQDNFGSIVLIGISAGLMLYWLFMILKAKYRKALF